MSMREQVSRLDAVQRGLTFKVAASVVILVLAVGAFLAYQIALSRLEAPDLSSLSGPGPAVAPEAGPAASTAIDSTRAIVEDILAVRRDPTSVGVSIAVVAGLCLAAVWLGLGLTYLALGAAAAGAWALASLTAAGKEYAPLALGVVALSASFITLMRGARLVVSSPACLYVLLGAKWLLLESLVIFKVLRVMFAPVGPMELLTLLALAGVGVGAAWVYWRLLTRWGGMDRVGAVAHTVLAEAVRMRVSLLPIVLLIFGMAALPGLMEADQPLRYRVQSFIQYGTGGTFWLIALLVAAFSVATVAFDQRDKTIWQTMTKPVAPWQYVLGKWLGVSVLAGVLLAVSGSGVFLFVDYLRTQPAVGEKAAYVSEQGPISEDRLILETQVLTARDAVRNTPLAYDRAQFEQNLISRVETELQNRRGMGESVEGEEARKQDLIRQMKESLEKSVQVFYRTIAPASNQVYTFRGLGEAREQKRPLILRFKVSSGSNAPDALYRITVTVRGSEPQVHQVVLGQWQYIRLLPEAVDANGEVAIDVFNGDIFQRVANPENITFPPDGLEISYTAGTYRTNFFKVLLVLWVKLAFLAMLGVSLATFLSFPVAMLVSMTTFFAAEGTNFLSKALESFWTTDREGKTLYLNVVIEWVASSIAWTFSTYAELNPTTRLVEGLRLSWTSVAGGTVVLEVWTVVLFIAGTLILRRRELAVYSGH